MAKKEESKWPVIREWDSWAQKNPDAAKQMNGMLFFTYLQRDRPDLLEFKAGNQDKWQIVHSWLLRERRVTD